MDSETSRARAMRALEELQREHPDAVALARLTCLAVRIDATFLREARLQLLPGVSAEAEADLWFSSVVESRSASGFVLLKEVTQALRHSLAQEPELLQRAWSLRLRFHSFLTPEMRLEEQISWLAMVEPNNPARLNEALLPAVGAMSMGGERAMGVARWARRAIPRLPAQAVSTEAGVALAFGTTERLGFSPALFQGMESGVVSPPLIDAVRADPHQRKTCRVGVRWGMNALILEEEPVEQTHQEVVLPASVPRMLYLMWTEPWPGHELVVAEPLSLSVPLPENIRRLTLRTIEGDEYLIEVGRQPTGPGAATREDEHIDSMGTAPEGDAYDRLFRPLFSSTVMRPEEEVVRNYLESGGQTIIVEAPSGYGKSTLLSRINEAMGRSRLSMARLNVRGMLLSTQGYLRNLLHVLPFGGLIARRLRQRAVRQCIDDAMPSDWRGGDERVIEAIGMEVPFSFIGLMDDDAQEDLIHRVSSYLRRVYPETSEHFHVERDEDPETHEPRMVFTTDKFGARCDTTVTRSSFEEFYANFREPLMRTLGVGPDGTLRAPGYGVSDPELYEDLMRRAEALVESQGAEGLARVIERDLLPGKEDELLVIVIEGLDSSSFPRAREFVEILHGWTQKRDSRWSRFRLVLSMTPGVTPFPGARSVSLPGFSVAQIEELARLKAVKLSAQHAEYLHQFTGGSPQLLVKAIRAIHEHEDDERHGGTPIPELLWEAAFRKDIENFRQWLERMPHVLEALGAVNSGLEASALEVARLLDTGVLDTAADGYAVRASLYAPLALWAREKVRSSGYHVDVLVNATPGTLPSWFDSFVDLLAKHLERALGREPRVQVDVGDVMDSYELSQSWTILNLFTTDFQTDGACWDRALHFEQRERTADTPLALYVLLDAVPTHQIVEGRRLLDLRNQSLVWKFSRPTAVDEDFQLAALRAAHQLTFMMLHSPESFDVAYAEAEHVDVVRQASEDEVLELLYQGGEVEDAIREQIPRLLEREEVHDDKLPSSDNRGEIKFLDEPAVSLRRSSLELLGGGAASILADIRLEDVSLDVYIDKGEYYGMTEEEQSKFPLVDEGLNEHTVVAEPTVSLSAVAQLRIETEVSEDGIPNIATVVVMEVTDIVLLDIH